MHFSTVQKFLCFMFFTLKLVEPNVSFEWVLEFFHFQGQIKKRVGSKSLCFTKFRCNSVLSVAIGTLVNIHRAVGSLANTYHRYNYKYNAR